MCVASSSSSNVEHDTVALHAQQHPAFFFIAIDQMTRAFSIEETQRGDFYFISMLGTPNFSTTCSSPRLAKATKL
jgi:hypothetical protein